MTIIINVKEFRIPIGLGVQLYLGLQKSGIDGMFQWKILSCKSWLRSWGGIKLLKNKPHRTLSWFTTSYDIVSESSDVKLCNVLDYLNNAFISLIV